MEKPWEKSHLNLFYSCWSISIHHRLFIIDQSIGQWILFYSLQILINCSLFISQLFLLVNWLLHINQLTHDILPISFESKPVYSLTIKLRSNPMDWNFVILIVWTNHLLIVSSGIIHQPIDIGFIAIVLSSPRMLTL